MSIKSLKVYRGDGIFAAPYEASVEHQASCIKQPRASKTRGICHRLRRYWFCGKPHV